MKKNRKTVKQASTSEQGMALITTMMCLLLCTSLGLAVLFNSVGEAALSGGYKRNEQAFYAADAGIGITRIALRNALNDAIKAASATLSSSPTYGSRTVSGFTIKTYDPSQLATVLQSTSMLTATGAAVTNAKAEVASRSTALTNAGFDVDISLSLLGVSATSPIDLQQVITNIFNVNVLQDKPEVVASVTGRYGYTITATGNNNVSTDNPTRATAKAIETGVIAVTLNMQFVKNPSSGSYGRVFSQYGTFFNRYPAGGVLASGTFGGKVHTNETMRFSSSNSVTFQGEVTQVNSQYQYDSNYYNVNQTNRTGLTFNSTFSTTSTLPPPSNAYAQELAVLNASGMADVNFPSTNPLDPTEPPKPTTSQLTTLLRNVNNNPPATSGTTIADGVYLPVQNVGGANTITGGGIYVKGAVSEMALTYSGNAQVYTIKQGSTTTTITINPPTSSSAGTTVIASGSSSTTYQGVPLDRTSPIASEQKPATLLYVDGSISNLHGPAASGGTVAAAISKNTALTITSTGDITVTGNLTYQEPTVDMAGASVSYANGYTPTNVLGLYTNAGKIAWQPSTTYTPTNTNMTVDAAMVAFNEPALNIDSTAQTGGWLSDCGACSSSTVITLRGSRTVSKLLSIVNYKGERYNRFFDPRFANGAMAPPFFPVTRVTNTVTAGTTTINTYTNQVYTESNTWQRTYS